MENKKELKALLAYHDNLYYNEDNPELTDAEYDALKKQLGEEYETVPGEASSVFSKYTHSHLIKSLSKVNSDDDLRKELIRLAPGVIQPKLDGLTLVIYPDGACVTRGSGSIGENISQSAAKINNLPINPKEPVRIEAVIRKDTFQEIIAEQEDTNQRIFKNPRNAAAGMLRNKDASKVRGITYKAYNIVGSTLSEKDQLKSMENMGYQVIESFFYGADEIEKAFEYVKQFDREAYPYEIDGLVIKSNKPDALALFGETGHHPKNMAAWKFPSEGKWTTLLDVIWQTGRTGRITPVGIVSPVSLLGSEVGRATLHNNRYIEELNITKGSEVLLIKANDVIPAIIESRNYESKEKIEIPTTCPECGGDTTTINDQLFCTNPECGAKLHRNTCHLAKRDALDIDGLSEETVRKMIDAGFIKHPFDLFDITKEQILTLEGYKEKSAEKLYQGIQKAKNPPLDRFIYAAGIANVGRSLSKEIASEYGSLELFLEDIKSGCNKFSEIEGIGAVLISTIQEHYPLLEKLNKKITPQTATKQKKADHQLTFVITGSLPQPRKHYETLIKEAGHKVSGSVSKKTDYVLVGEDAGSKLDKANSLGISILNTEDELLEII